VAFFLGIDGGGTKTTCVVGDETKTLGSATTGGSNITRVGHEAARAAVAAAIHEACAAAKINPSQIARACVGASGAGREETRSAIHRAVAALVPGEIEIVADTEIALEAAFGEGPGIIVIAGTGSIAYGRNSRAETARAGGWGYAISDEGSGHWIGRAAVIAALRARDEGGNTQLLDDAKRTFGAANDEEFILTANASPDFAALLPAVLAAADTGDPVARHVLACAGTELARIANLVAKRLFSNVDKVPVAMVGGVFGNSTLVRQVFYDVVRDLFPMAVILATVVEPVNGALARARRARR
jgi:N-acetylglucosamine kinase-like BadF-type ATPase